MLMAMKKRKAGKKKAAKKKSAKKRGPAKSRIIRPPQ
jgi:hypothetical protein